MWLPGRVRPYLLDHIRLADPAGEIQGSAAVTTIDYDSSAIDELARASARSGSLLRGLEHMGGLGRLGELAKDITALAENVSKSGYVPPARRAEHDALVQRADRTTDRELARHYRAKARQIRNQLEGTNL
jgi:hypothetical protein